MTSIIVALISIHKVGFATLSSWQTNETLCIYFSTLKYFRLNKIILNDNILLSLLSIVLLVTTAHGCSIESAHTIESTMVCTLIHYNVSVISACGLLVLSLQQTHT